jgi:hypothetical protein
VRWLLVVIGVVAWIVVVPVVDVVRLGLRRLRPARAAVARQAVPVAPELSVAGNRDSRGGEAGRPSGLARQQASAES